MGTLPRFGPPVLIAVGNNRGALRVPLRLADRGFKETSVVPGSENANQTPDTGTSSNKCQRVQSLKEVHDTLSNKLHLEEVEHNQQQPPSYQNGTILYK